MPYSLPLPPRLANNWRVKIYDGERLEPPHVTIVKGRLSWRIDLRRRTFMDDTPPAKEVHKDVLKAVEENWDRLCREWDRLYPNNPVEETEDDDHG